MKKYFISILIALFTLSGNIISQGKIETVLDSKILKILIDETSGALQLKNLKDLGGYEYDRKADEYSKEWREINYIREKATEYGFKDVKVEKWKSDSKIWDGEIGELWLVEPEKRLLISYRDEVASLAPNSTPGEYEAEMVYVGKGSTVDDYKNLDISGKIVVGEANLNELYRLAVQKYKAKGIISINTHHYFDNPDKILWQSLPYLLNSKISDSLKYYLSFGFNISPRIGKELSDLYYRVRDSRSSAQNSKNKVVLKAIIKANYRDYEDQMVSAVIPGDGSKNEEICLTAHLFEGYQKQGANDDFSGCVTMLEVGRSLIKLINEGIISKPARTIRFLWVPEITGTYWYLMTHKDISDKTILNINLDMVGEDTHKNLNSLVFYQNQQSRAHWMDDATSDLLDWISKNCSERLETRGFSYGYQIFDPIGTRHPFYYNVEPFSSGSDHIVFQMQNFKIPSVFFNNWPDVNYHTSFDRPEFADATELKRIGVITSALSIIGSPTKEADFYRISNIVYGRVLQRLDNSYSRILLDLNSIATENISDCFRDSKYMIEANIEREKTRLETLLSLSIDKSRESEYKEYLILYKTNLKEMEKRFISGLESQYKLVCKRKNIKAKMPEVSEIEKEMDSLIPEDIIALEPDPEAKNLGRNIWFGMTQIEGLSTKYFSELKNFINGKYTVLEIRNLVSAEFEPIPLEPTLKYFKYLEKMKYLRLKRK